jgi:hypothetical protein
MSPKRRNGTESVVIPGTTSRITITSSGFLGMSLSVIFAQLILVLNGCGPLI